MKATGLAAAAQCSLSWGQRCYVNWLLFGKWGRSPSYEQNAPHCHALAPFQDVFHLHSWFGSVQWSNALSSWFEWLKWCIEWHLLAVCGLTRGKCLCKNASLWLYGGGCCCVCLWAATVNSWVTVPHSWSHSPGSVYQNYSFLGMCFYSSEKFLLFWYW